MNTNSNDPINASFDQGGYLNHTGLTKREYFAAMAMQGLLANSQISNGEKFISEWAVKHADSLIESLNK